MLEYIKYIYGLITGISPMIFDIFTIIFDFIMMIPTPMLVLLTLAVGFFIIRLIPL